MPKSQLRRSQPRRNSAKAEFGPNADSPPNTDSGARAAAASRPHLAAVGPEPRKSIRAENEKAILSAAEHVFAEHGFKGATTAEIAARAGIPKANLHYYFPTKAALYRRVIERVLEMWMGAAGALDESDDPATALAGYIGTKMHLARVEPLGSKIWASEIMRGGSVIQDFLETTLRDWVATREVIFKRWIASGKLRPIEPRTLLSMIWAATQHYADFSHQITVLNDGRPLSDAQFETAKREVIATILRGTLP
ncbi:transcriptional regulator, TetR family [Rhizobiales bacterium GAS191]|jgi:TetR/AcrR family transcriptional regulator|nr:transcriptional regulator, TetR family [Rhizobiales bacterium GAS113]SED69891.1 transcriptional regulator, TetR family [Rhizobiales bacterium GAS191]SEE72701.1 transcriptional regulator, TetR family [Rhizobiales bacterium GAS188]